MNIIYIFLYIYEKEQGGAEGREQLQRCRAHLQNSPGHITSNLKSSAKEDKRKDKERESAV